ncbi:MAG: Sensor protein resE [Candidatus Saccharibacteria bacterium]|nr:Sensor protein resE [Candidatus Saccharibacteria bacterium]
MDLGLVIALTTTVVNIALGAFVLLQDVKSKIGRVFAMTMVVASAWVISASISELPDVGFVTNNMANAIAFATGYLVIVCAMIFTYIFPVTKQPRKSTVVLLLAASIVNVSLSLTPLVSGAADKVADGVVEFTIGSLVWIYVILFMLPLGVLARNLFSRMRRGIAVRQRQQARLVLIAFVGTALLGIILNLVIPTVTGSWQSSQFGPLAIIFMTALLVYAMERHGLFDIKRAVIRTFNYILTLLTLGFIYYAIAFLISNIVLHASADNISSAVSPLNITLALLLAFVFQPIKRFFDRITNFVFYRDTYSENEFFARLTHTLSTMTDLSSLLHYASTEISKTVKASFGAFLVYRIDERPLYMSTVRGKAIPQQDAKALDAYVTAHGANVLITNELSPNDETDSREIKRLLIGHRIALALPIKQDDLIIGYFFLGEHLSSEYTRSDIGALQTVANELVIAMENALSIQAVRDLNATLQQRVDNATRELRASNSQLRRLDKAKDDFISMASHQLRTPLTSVKGYISMVREGDVGKITKSQDQMLGEAFASSERMVHLINDFLNVSRLQTGKFLVDKRPVDLAKVIEQELDSLVTNAKSRNLVFTYTPPKDFPILNLDEDKMRQVIMNFSDNAIYYSTEGTKVKVKLAVQGKEAVFTVTDTGIGVPRAEQSQLFSKFYRASNARRQRPDGTGVGLYLAKIVIDAHDGKVVFESVEGKGSTFGFRLPIEELATVRDANNLDDKNNKD